MALTNKKFNTKVTFELADLTAYASLREGDFVRGTTETSQSKSRFEHHERTEGRQATR